MDEKRILPVDMDAAETDLVKAIAQIGVHDHLCLIYETREEQFAAAIPFMKIGLERGEKCIYIADDNTVAMVIDAMKTAGMDVEAAIESGKLTIINKQDAYLKQGYFDPDWMIGFLKCALEEAKAAGFPALRATGEMTWMLGDEPGTERLIEYEAKLNYFLPENDILAICQYNRKRFSTEILKGVISTHPLVIYGGVVCKNFYYVPPDEFLRVEQPGKEIDRLLANIRDREKTDEELLKFKFISDKSSDAHFLLNRDARFLYVNEAACRLMGYSREELLELSVPDVDAVYDREKYLELFELIQHRTIPPIETINKRKDGSVFPAELSVTGYKIDEKTYMFAALRDITERKKAEKDIQQSVEKFSAAFHASPDLMAITRLADGTILEVNEAFSQLLGYTREESIGKTTAELFIWKDISDRSLFIRRLEESGRINDFEVRLRRKDGALITCIGSARTITLGDEKCVLSVVHDITERKQAEEAMRTANSYNRRLIEASLDPLVTIGPDGKITDVNNATEAATGYLRNDLIGTDFSDYFTEPEKARAGYTQVFTEGLVRDYPLAIRHRDGHITYVLYNASIYRDEEGQVIGVFAAARDVTERKLAEMERQQYFNLFQVSADLMCIADPNGAFLKTNPACSDTLGYTEAELVSRPFIDFVHPDDKQPTLDEMARQIHKGFSLNFENRYICKDGSIRWLSWHAYHNKDEGITYATARDITERKQTEEERETLLRWREGLNLLQRALLVPATQDQKLKTITDGIVRIFNADFCRIWLIRPGDLCGQGCVHAEVLDGPHVCRYRDRCLHLRASSGRYTNTDGETHRRVPFGCYKIGLIASGDAHKFLTNDVQKDPRIHNHDWARELGLVSFAGYQLRVPDGETIGVLALFAKHPITVAEEYMLDGLSTTTALVIQQAAADEALKKSEEFNRSILETVDEGFIVIDRDYRIVAANRAFTEQCGMSLEDMVGRHCFEISHHCVTSCYEEGEMCAVKQVFDTGETGSAMHTHHDVKGMPVYVETRAYPLTKDESGKVMTVIEIIIDITEKKKAEESVRAAAREWSESFDAMTDGVSILSADYTIMTVNQSLCRLLGKTPEELIGKKCYQMFHEKNCPIAACPLAGPKGRSQKEYIEIYEPTLDKWLAVSTSPVLDETGSMIKVVHTVRDVTESRQAEEQLQKSEGHLRTLVQTIPDLIWLKDAEGVYMACNPMFERFFGAREADIIGKTDYDFVDKELADFFREHDRKAMAAGKPSSNEEWITFADDGHRALLDTIKTPMYDAGGKLIGVLGIGRDITERKLAEEDRKAHIRFLEYLERVNDAIRQSADVEKMLEEVVQTVFSIFGCDRAWLFYPCDPDASSFRVPVEISRPEYPGANARNIEVPMSPEMALNLQEAMESDDPVTYTIGTERPINKVTAEQFGVQSQMFVPLYPKVGKPWVLGLHQCSYPRVWTKGENRLFKEISRRITDGLSSVLFLRELQEGENKYRTLLENIPQKIFYKDRSSVYISCNYNYAADLRIKPDEIAGKTDYDFFPKELAEKYRGDDKRLMELGKTEDIEEQYIQDGQDVWVHTVKTPVKDSSGRITGILGVFWDITEYRKLETQLRHAQKMEAVGTLAGGIAHDFNNILNVIIGYGVMLLDRLGDDPLSREQLNEVLNAADRAANLTKRLLIFSRKQVVDMKPANLKEILIGIEKMLSRIIGEDIAFTMELASIKMIVLVDAGQMEQVLMNLVSNARYAMPNGGKLTISTGIKEIDKEYVAAYGYGKPGMYALISVADTGSGMNAETQKKIFEPFFTTKGVGEGTGLGLSIVYGIIKQHNGYINLYSEPGKGTEFKIYLPLIEEEAAPGQEVQADSSIKGGSETVLLAEDDPALRKLSKTVLEAFGYSVITAEDGEDAITKYRQNRDNIRLVVLDMIMPKKNGKEAYAELKKIRPDIKALFVSGYTMDVITKKELLDNGMDFILKPVSPKDLVKKVREVLDR